MVGSILIFGSTIGGAFGGTICMSANFGGVPLVTGVGPLWPPPPPIACALGGAGGGVSNSTGTSVVTAFVPIEICFAIIHAIKPMARAWRTTATAVDVGSRFTALRATTGMG